MASSPAKTVAEYLRSLPPEQKQEIEAVRKVIKRHLPRGYEEGMQWGMISYFIPLSRYPDTYNGQALGLAAIAAQKQYNALYLLTVYGDPETKRWFEAAWKASGKKLDMGKSCVRWKRAADLPLDVVGEVIARVGVDAYIARYEQLKKPTKKTAAARRPARARGTTTGRSRSA